MRSIGTFCGMLMTVVLFAGCGPSETVDGKHPPAGKDGAASLTPVSLTLNWYPEAEHGGYYAALVHGYYREEGLDVTIHPGGPDIPVVQLAVEGRTDFGVDNGDKLLLVRAQQADAVALFAPLQISPRCLMVHQKSGIKSFDDLAKQEGFTLAMNAGQPFAMFLEKRLDLSKMTIAPYTGSLVAFLSEEKFGQQAYNFSEPYNARKQGSDPQNLMVSDLGFNPYTSLLLTGRKQLETRKPLVEKMVRATRRGWEKYLSDPKSTNDHIHKQNPEMADDVLDFGVETLKPLCLPDGLPPERIGEMTDARWKELADQLVEIKAIPASQADFRGAYTLEFQARVH